MSDQNFKTKPRYESPILVPLGEMVKGSGVCSTGSSALNSTTGNCFAGTTVAAVFCSAGGGDTAPVNCTAGTNATTGCTMGTAALATCTQGVSALTACSAGNTTLPACTAGTVATGACTAGGAKA